MQEKMFRDYCKKRNMSGDAVEKAVGQVIEFEKHLGDEGVDLDEARVEDVKKYVARLIAENRNNEDRLLALARYSYAARMNDVFIYFASILGGRTVLPSISERLAAIAGEEARGRVFEGVEPPPLGSPPEDYPPVTRRLIERLEAELGLETCRMVLAGNHHRVPVEGFEGRKRLFEESETVDEFLVKDHERAVAELERFMAEGRLWYEQEITPETVEYVRGNQEVLSGIRSGDKIYTTKFPYAPGQYLTESDPLMKRYYMCHCPLARASILSGEPEISPTWCYCSGGYEKLKFDVVFGEPVEVEVLESALAGDPRCRFSVKIPEGKLK
ncbi:MAG: DUF6144 family protein [Candidatus Bathyarchaeota archaeon]|nr:DUF6144 family protein [Candidatus Bathyarchaeota archaeon]MDH5792479.1 DUF6144 family protein [Candidatus Bathyarchaeota archaeon]